jgi:hypothetical protein
VDTVARLVIDLLEWIGPRPRPYAEVQEVWRTSCPQLAVWEDAVDHGYVETRFEPGRGLVVAVSTSGKALLAVGPDRSHPG